MAFICQFMSTKTLLVCYITFISSAEILNNGFCSSFQSQQTGVNNSFDNSSGMNILYEIYTVIIYMSRVVEIESLTETESNCDLGHRHAHTCYHCFIIIQLQN